MFLQCVSTVIIVYISDECDEPTSCIVQPIVRPVVKLCNLCVLTLGVSLVS